MLVLGLGAARRVGWRRVEGSVFAGQFVSTRGSFCSGLDAFLGIINKESWVRGVFICVSYYRGYNVINRPREGKGT